MSNTQPAVMFAAVNASGSAPEAASGLHDASGDEPRAEKMWKEENIVTTALVTIVPCGTTLRQQVPMKVAASDRTTTADVSAAAPPQLKSW